MTHTWWGEGNEEEHDRHSAWKCPEQSERGATMSNSHTHSAGRWGGGCERQTGGREQNMTAGPAHHTTGGPHTVTHSSGNRPHKKTAHSRGASLSTEGTRHSTDDGGGEKKHQRPWRKSGPVHHAQPQPQLLLYFYNPQQPQQPACFTRTDWCLRVAPPTRGLWSAHPSPPH